MGINPHFLDSITDANAESRGRLVVSGSHGGIYPASVASRWDIQAVLFNDAGIGFEDAGVAGVLELANVGMAAAAVDCNTCRIGSATDATERGRISVVNGVAKSLGIKEGMSVIEALKRLTKAPTPTGKLPPVPEARSTITLPASERVIHLLDSASLVTSDDIGEIVITGSHGGLIGGDPARALKTAARIAVFNDAGVGIDGVGISRLPALNGRGIAAVTVDCWTARIGDAVSTLKTGVLSHVNRTAEAQGAQRGSTLHSWLEMVQEIPLINAL